jgi:transcriptional regulator with XRE-family HTH domain
VNRWVAPLTPCSMYYIVHTSMATLGDYLRQRRETLRTDDPAFSLRRVAERIGVEPSYLSKVERDVGSPPAEDTLMRLAADLGLDGDVVLALAGKVSSDLQQVIRKRPQLIAELIRQLRDLPDHAVLRLVREVRDGNW